MQPHAVPRGRFDLRLVAAQVRPKRFHRAQLFRDAHLAQWQCGFHDNLVKPLSRQMQARVRHGNSLTSNREDTKTQLTLQIFRRTLRSMLTLNPTVTNK